MQRYHRDYELKNGQKLTVRVPEEEDADALLRLMQILDGETKFLAREPGEFQFTLEREQAFIRSKQGSETGQFLIAEVEGAIVGSCNVERVSRQKRYLHRAAMAVALEKAYWGMGIGSVLMRECIRWCRDAGLEQLELEVVTANERAIALYQRFGFEITGTKKHALKYGDGTYGDEYILCLFLRDGEKP